MRAPPPTLSVGTHPTKKRTTHEITEQQIDPVPAAARGRRSARGRRRARGGPSAQASTAATPAPPVFKIADGARLYVPASTPASGRAAAWVVFRTSRHVDARLTVVQVAQRSGRSYTASGGASCIRSAVPSAAGRPAITAGHRYRVSFYARAGTGQSSERKLVTTRDLTATTFTAPTAASGRRIAKPADAPCRQSATGRSAVHPPPAPSR